jgi:hypothetical protein
MKHDKLNKTKRNNYRGHQVTYGRINSVRCPPGPVLKYSSSRALNEFRERAVTTVSGSLFHSAVTWVNARGLHRVIVSRLLIVLYT